MHYTVQADGSCEVGLPNLDLWSGLAVEAGGVDKNKAEGGEELLGHEHDMGARRGAGVQHSVPGRGVEG